MRKFLVFLVAILFIGSVAYSQVGASFTIAPKKDEKTNGYFGLSVDLLKFADAIAIGFDWGLFKTDSESKKLFGWCFRLYLDQWGSSSLAMPIGYDFRNKRFYIGLGVMY